MIIKHEVAIITMVIVQIFFSLPKSKQQQTQKIKTKIKTKTKIIAKTKNKPNWYTFCLIPKSVLSCSWEIYLW